jgi:prepilin-type N-terminal cleavage/methylation domain-containing protein
MRRSGFTLIELMVATIVFMIGFAAVFGLFLGGVRFRKLADDTTRASLAASCIVDEIRASAGGGASPGGASPNSPLAPSAYVGSGFASVSGGVADATTLYPYTPIPNTWYQVTSCSNLYGDTTDKNTTVLHLQLLVVPFATSQPTLDTLYLYKHLLNSDLGPSPTNDQITAELVTRGIGYQFQSVITRRPSWLP